MPHSNISAVVVFGGRGGLVVGAWYGWQGQVTVLCGGVSIL